MQVKIFRWTFLPFLMVMALVAGGAFYQTNSVVPFWENDISMFKNYGHWGINYFPILSPLMTVLWLVLVITAFKLQFPNKILFYIANFFFLLLMASTFIYFAPFLLTHMGHPQGLTDQELASQLQTWARWDFTRQVIGLIPLGLFIYTYSNMRFVTLKTKNLVQS